jgi:S1-C subfamily serine protease
MNGHERRQPRTPISAFLVPLGLFIILAVLAWQFLWPGRQGGDPDAVPRVVEARGDLAEDEKSTIALFKAASPSVVNITSLAVRQGFLNLDVQQIPQGSGSGFIWDAQGHVVTNYHVIQNAGAARVTLSDHSTWDARVVGAYPDSDLAVLWINAPKGRLRPLPIGASEDLQVGQKAFAIGNPFGLDQTLTTGIVSAVGREIESVTRRPIKGVIQTDAAINPGNSGGPLLDSAGRLIGVNTAIFSPSGASAGIGFAIPVDEVNRIVPQLIANGKVIRPGLGVHIAEDQIARRLGLNGVLILQVQPGGPAAKAGLRGTRRDEDNQIVLGDVVTAIDDAKVSRVNDLHGALQARKVGDTVRVTVARDGEEMQVEVTLDAIK